MCFTSSKSYKLLPLRYRKATVRNTKADKKQGIKGRGLGHTEHGD